VICRDELRWGTTQHANAGRSPGHALNLGRAAETFVFAALPDKNSMGDSRPAAHGDRK
jgi:hypothetical protein